MTRFSVVGTLDHDLTHFAPVVFLVHPEKVVCYFYVGIKETSSMNGSTFKGNTKERTHFAVIMNSLQLNQFNTNIEVSELICTLDKSTDCCMIKIFVIKCFIFSTLKLLYLSFV